MPRSADAARKAGVNSGGEMPVPIPNTEAKPARADGTGAQPGAGRAGRRRPRRPHPRAALSFPGTAGAPGGSPEPDAPPGAFFLSEEHRP